MCYLYRAYNYTVIQKEILTAPKVNESILYGVGYKPFAVGAFNFNLMSTYREGKLNPGYKHGMSGTPLYFVWVDMIRRCENPNRDAYKNYGGRGIFVCEEWHNPKIFFDWALTHGYKDDLLLDRIDNDGNYEPNNCRFVTSSVSSFNIRKRKDYDIRYINGIYSVFARRNTFRYFGGSARNIERARILRDKLIAKLNSGNYDPSKRNQVDECDKLQISRDQKTGRFLKAPRD